MSLDFTHNLLPDTQIGIAAVLGCVGLTEVRGGGKILMKEGTRKFCVSFTYHLSLGTCMPAIMWVWLSFYFE